MELAEVTIRAAVLTPGVKQELGTTEEELEELSIKEASLYRAMTARGNYLSQDRSDVQFAVKELSRGMSCPTVLDRNQLKRFGRYLIDRPRIINFFQYQEEVTIIDGWSDSDYAGCRRTRKSTSGGLIMLGSHLIKSWSFDSSNSRIVVWRSRILRISQVQLRCIRN